MHTICAGLWDKVQMAGKNDDVINAGVCRCLIQMAPHDFELAPMLKEGGGNCEAVVVAKQKES
jgi:hypothetical protein